jgi:hypothetical protein
MGCANVSGARQYHQTGAAKTPSYGLQNVTQMLDCFKHGAWPVRNGYIPLPS